MRRLTQAPRGCGRSPPPTHLLPCLSNLRREIGESPVPPASRCWLRKLASRGGVFWGPQASLCSLQAADKTTEFCLGGIAPQTLFYIINSIQTISLTCFSKRNDQSQLPLSYFSNGNNRDGEVWGEEFGEKAFLGVQPGPCESTGSWPCHQRPHKRGLVTGPSPSQSLYMTCRTGISPLLSGRVVPNLSGILGP